MSASGADHGENTRQASLDVRPFFEGDAAAVFDCSAVDSSSATLPQPAIAAVHPSPLLCAVSYPLTPRRLVELRGNPCLRESAEVEFEQLLVDGIQNR
jgi:hypothetical protein